MAQAVVITCNENHYKEYVIKKNALALLQNQRERIGDNIFILVVHRMESVKAIIKTEMRRVTEENTMVRSQNYEVLKYYKTKEITDSSNLIKLFSIL